MKIRRRVDIMSLGVRKNLIIFESISFYILKILCIFYYLAKTEKDAQDWVDAIKKATYPNSTNMIYVKIDPVNSTKVMTFYMSREEKKEEEEVLKM